MQPVTHRISWKKRKGFFAFRCQRGGKASTTHQETTTRGRGTNSHGRNPKPFTTWQTKIHDTRRGFGCSEQACFQSVPARGISPAKNGGFWKTTHPPNAECCLNARKVGLHEFFGWVVYCPSGRGVIGHCTAF